MNFCTLYTLGDENNSGHCAPVRLRMFRYAVLCLAIAIGGTLPGDLAAAEPGHAGGSSAGHDSGSSGASGGHTGGSSGGHDSGASGGHDSGSSGGHDSGASGGPGSGRGQHGLGGGLGKRARNKYGFDLDGRSGHTSGEHSTQTTDHGNRHSISGGHFFGAGWLSGSRHVPEAIGGGPQSGLGGAQFSGLGGGGRGFGFWGGKSDRAGSVDDSGDSGDGDTDTSIPEVPTDASLFVISGTGGSVLRTGDSGEELACERYEADTTTARQRLSGKNLKRLKLAGRLIAPTYVSDAPGYAGFAERNLGYYQEELEKPAGSPTLAGTYLGLIATLPVDFELVDRVDRILCLAPDSKRRQAVVDTAESQRGHLASFLGGMDTR